MKNKSFINLVVKVALSYVVVIVLLIFYYFYDFLGSSIPVVISFIINIFYASKKLLLEKSRHPFSLQIIFWFFNLLFLAIAPFFQYSVQWFELRNLTINDVTIFQLNILILFYMLTFSIIYNFAYNRMSSRYFVMELHKFDKKRVFLSVVLLLLILFFNVSTFGLEDMFLRAERTIENTRDSGNNILRVLLEASLYSACFLILLNIDNSRLRNGAVKLIICFLSILYVLILVFPTSRARFLVGAIYLGIFLYLNRKTRLKNLLLICLVFGFLLIMPMLSSIRYVNNWKELFFGISLGIDYKYFIKGDFSPYAIAIGALEYVKSEGFMYGKQMLSNILFFIPRSIWPDKEYSLGYTVADYFNHHIYNMASPLVIEFFVDFGFLGLILFTTLLSLICARADRLFWSKTNDSNRYLFEYIYPFMVVLFFFVNRGAFMSTFSRMIYMILGFLIIAPFVLKSIKLVNMSGKNDKN